MKNWTGSVLLSVSLVVCTASQAQNVDCSEVLAKDTTRLTSNRNYQLAWLNTVNEGNYESRKRSGRASVPGYFDGNYKSFSEKRSSYFAQQKYNSSEEESKAELRIETPSGAIQAWENCVLQSKNLVVWLKDVDQDSATLGIEWDPGDGMSAEPLQNVSAQIPGASVPTTLVRGTIYRSISRPSGRAVRGIVSGTVRPGTSSEQQFSKDFYIPAYKAPTPVPPQLVNATGTLSRVDAENQTPGCTAGPWVPILADGSFGIGLLGTTTSTTPQSAAVRLVKQPPPRPSLTKSDGGDRTPTTATPAHLQLPDGRQISIAIKNVQECTVDYQIMLQ